MTDHADRVRNWRTRHIDVPLGERVVELRTLAGLNRRQLARRLGISESQLQHAEDGENRFSAAQIWQICSVLAVSVPEVFAGLPDTILASPTDEQLTQPGVAEPGSVWAGQSSARPEILALAKAASRLAPEQLETLVEMVRGMKPKLGQ